MDILNIIKWLFFVVFVLVVALLIYQSRGWNIQWECNQWEAYSQSDYDIGRECTMVSCKYINTPENSLVQECECENGNFVKRICTSQYLERKMQWRSFV